MKHTDQSPQAREREELERQVEILRREVRQLRLEQDLLNKANELLKKGLGVDLQLLSNREKTLLIDALKENRQGPMIGGSVDSRANLTHRGSVGVRTHTRLCG